MLATEMFAKISIASARTHVCSEEALLSSGWISVGSELSSLKMKVTVF